jgi:sorbitol-specific phosphotransferase system component IIBC
LPDGWKIVPTSHALWSDLVDDKGRKRAAIFFKAAFYDYNAHISFECRYVIDDYVDDVVVDGVTMRKCQVFDKATDQPLWTSEAADDRDFKAQDRNREEATAWLNAQFPKHDDPFAYWND